MQREKDDAKQAKLDYKRALDQQMRQGTLGDNTKKLQTQIANDEFQNHNNYALAFTQKAKQNDHNLKTYLANTYKQEMLNHK